MVVKIRDSALLPFSEAKTMQASAGIFPSATNAISSEEGTERFVCLFYSVLYALVRILQKQIQKDSTLIAAHIGHNRPCTHDLPSHRSVGKSDNCHHWEIAIFLLPTAEVGRILQGETQCYAAWSLQVSNAFRNSSRNSMGSAQI